MSQYVQSRGDIYAYKMLKSQAFLQVDMLICVMLIQKNEYRYLSYSPFPCSSQLSSQIGSFLCIPYTRIRRVIVINHFALILLRLVQWSLNIFEIFFRQCFQDAGGMFLEVKIFKNFDPIWGFDPKFLFRNHQFLVISHIDGVSWSDCLPRGVYI